MMFLRHIRMDEQDEGGEGGGGIPDRTAEFTEILDKMEAADAAEVAPEPAPVAEAQETPAEPAPVAESPEAQEDPVEPAPVAKATPEPPDWLTDDVRSRAAQYHMTDEILSSHGSLEEVEAGMLLIDNYQARQLDLRRQEYDAQTQEYNAQNQPAEPPAPGEEPPAGDPAQPEPFQFQDFGPAIGELVTGGYDAELTTVMEGMHKQSQYLHDRVLQQDQDIAQFREHASRVQQGAISNHNDRVMTMVDALDRKDLFGTEQTHTPEQVQNAERVNQEIEELIRYRGQTLSPDTVQQAYQRVFASQLIQEAGSKRVTALKKQSSRRMGQGQTATPRDDLAWDGDAGDDPVLLAMGNRFIQENAGM